MSKCQYQSQDVKVKMQSQDQNFNVNVKVNRNTSVIATVIVKANVYIKLSTSIPTTGREIKQRIAEGWVTKPILIT